jgi:hypothetical protein
LLIFYLIIRYNGRIMKWNVLRAFMIIIMKIIIIKSGFFLLPVYSFSQENDTISSMEFAERGAIPQVLRQPRQGEILRYPQDTIIGELGRGQASEGAYNYAGNILSALLLENRGSRFLSGRDSAFWDELFVNLTRIGPRKYRLGGGREEIDGNTSFLFRFIGREQGIAGELYIRREGDTWMLDDIILERARDLPNGKESYKYDFSPYERFW